MWVEPWPQQLLHFLSLFLPLPPQEVQFTLMIS